VFTNIIILMNNDPIQRITPIHSRSPTPDSINRITPYHSRSVSPELENPDINIDSPPLIPPSPEKLSSTSPWIKHLRVCSELYGVKYNYAIKCGELRLLYYTKSNRDMDGNILYPAKLQMFGTPSENALVRSPWTGIALRNPTGYSHDAVII
jgi:hypothetical protein